MSLREKLAALEHRQWMEWSKEVAKGENLSIERIERWERFWVPYAELSEKDKEPDRRWAEQVWHIIEPYIAELTNIGDKKDE